MQSCRSDRSARREYASSGNQIDNTKIMVLIIIALDFLYAEYLRSFIVTSTKVCFEFLLSSSRWARGSCHSTSFIRSPERLLEYTTSNFTIIHSRRCEVTILSFWCLTISCQIQTQCVTSQVSIKLSRALTCHTTFSEEVEDYQHRQHRSALVFAKISLSWISNPIRTGIVSYLCHI